MAQLVERLLLTPEFRGLNLDIGKLLYGTFFTVNCIKKTKIKKKRPGMAHLRSIKLVVHLPTIKRYDLSK